MFQFVTAKESTCFWIRQRRNIIGTLILGPGVNALLVWEAALQQLLRLSRFLYCFSVLSVARQQLPLFHYLQFSSSLLLYNNIFFSIALQSNAHNSLLIREVSKSHKTTHHILYDSTGRVISSSQRPLPDNTKHTTNIHAAGGIRTRKLSRRAAADLRLWPHGQWDRLS